LQEKANTTDDQHGPCDEKEHLVVEHRSRVNSTMKNPSVSATRLRNSHHSKPAPKTSNPNIRGWITVKRSPNASKGRNGLRAEMILTVLVKGPREGKIMDNSAIIVGELTDAVAARTVAKRTLSVEGASGNNRVSARNATPVTNRPLHGYRLIACDTNRRDPRYPTIKKTNYVIIARMTSSTR